MISTLNMQMRTVCSVNFSVQEAGGCPLRAAHRKILKPRGFVHWANAAALRVNVIAVEAEFVVQEASACALEEMPHVLFKRESIFLAFSQAFFQS